MLRRAMVLSSVLAAALAVPFGGAAAAQEQPVCGPPGQEVPATIVGSGTIVGTSGDDVIVGGAEDDRIVGGPGNDIICGEAGNDRAIRRPG